MKELRSESSFSRACVKQKHVMTSLHQEAYHSFPHPRSKIVRRENLLFVLMMEKLSRQKKRDLPSARHKRPKKTFLLKKNNLKDDLSKFLQHSFITIHFNLAKEQSQSYSYWFLQKQFCFSFQSQHVVSFAARQTTRRVLSRYSFCFLRQHFANIFSNADTPQQNKTGRKPNQKIRL